MLQNRHQVSRVNQWLGEKTRQPGDTEAALGHVAHKGQAVGLCLLIWRN
jgi:hypothetical protein